MTEQDMEREFAKLTVTPKAEKSVRAGHPWVYGEEVTATEGSYENGDTVDVYTQKGKWLGCGFVNDHSKIRVRLITRDTNARFDEAFWKRRVRYAIDYRRTVMGEDFDCCRLIFGEADQFPGFTVDKFGDILVTECLSYGIDMRKGVLYGALREILAEYGYPVRAIYERNESQIRTLEGLPLEKGFYAA